VTGAARKPAIGVARWFAGVSLITAQAASRIVAAGRRGDLERLDDTPREWGRRLCELIGIAVEVEHPDRLAAPRPCVFVANHASFADVWVLLAVIPGSVRFVAKKELLRIPVFGTALRAGGQIVIDRKNLRRAFGAYDEAAAAIRRGLSAVVFVEGTRSPDGTLQGFKKGPFVLAITAGVPIVPIYLEGTWGIMPRGRLVPRPARVRVLVGEPIATSGLAYEDRDALAARTREAMLALRQGPSYRPPASVDALGAGG